MSLVKKNGSRLNALPMLFDDFFSREIFDWKNSNFSNTSTTIPAVNIKETPEHYEVEVAAPGMTKKDFNLELDGNILTISSERQSQREENENESERYSLREFSYQSFQRTFTLQKEVVDVEKIEAKYENGILRLLIPKKEEARQKPPRQIQIA
jgi:HSP20 family protein